MRPAPVKPMIAMSDLDQIDVRIGTVLAVEDIEGSRKLMKLSVDLGDHERVVVAGIKKERENPQEIVGRQTLLVVNLPPQEMAGVLSEAMLFDVGYSDGIQPVLAVPEGPVPNGVRVG